MKVEHYKMSKWFTCIKTCDKKWIKVNDLLCGQYSVNNNIRLKTPMLRSGLCNYSDAYIVTKETITVEGDNNDKTRNKKLMFKTIMLLKMMMMVMK